MLLVETMLVLGGLSVLGSVGHGTSVRLAGALAERSSLDEAQAYRALLGGALALPALTAGGLFLVLDPLVMGWLMIGASMLLCTLGFFGFPVYLFVRYFVPEEPGAPTPEDSGCCGCPKPHAGKCR